MTHTEVDIQTLVTAMEDVRPFGGRWAILLVGIAIVRALGRLESKLGGEDD